MEYVLLILLLSFYIGGWGGATLNWTSTDLFNVVWTRTDFRVQFMRFQTIKASEVAANLPEV